MNMKCDNCKEEFYERSRYFVFCDYDSTMNWTIRYFFCRKRCLDKWVLLS